MVLATLLALSGCAYLGYAKDPFTDIPNLHQVNAQLYRGGRPAPAGWDRLSALGIATVVSLRGEDDGVNDDRAAAERLGMRFVRIPLSVDRQPAEPEVLAFLNAVLDIAHQPVFVYCTSGRDRTGAMIAMYRVVVDGWTIHDAYKEAKRRGFWPYKGDAQLKAFIHQLKDHPVYWEQAQLRTQTGAVPGLHNVSPD